MRLEAGMINTCHNCRTIVAAGEQLCEKCKAAYKRRLEAILRAKEEK